MAALVLVFAAGCSDDPGYEGNGGGTQDSTDPTAPDETDPTDPLAELFEAYSKWLFGTEEGEEDYLRLTLYTEDQKLWNIMGLISKQDLTMDGFNEDGDAWAYDSSTNTLTLSNPYEAPEGIDSDSFTITFTVSGDGNVGSTYLYADNFKVWYLDPDEEVNVALNLGSVTFTLNWVDE